MEPDRVDNDTLAAVQSELDQAHAHAMEALRSKGTRGQFILLVSKQDPEDGTWGAEMFAGGSSERYNPDEFDGDEDAAQAAMTQEVHGFLQAALGAVVELALEAGAVDRLDVDHEGEEEDHGDEPA